ncbi:MAG TPA: DUF1214 domain-containing protein [Caulobacteraceae bacterium]|jgi:hypothetical protein|nr:DUF1214 domain-containing protein [Caulobacteraceae bacterium]
MSSQTPKSTNGVIDRQLLADAYAYLLARKLVIRQEHNDAAEQGFSYNAIKYNPLGSANFVNPNFDVAYLEAWVAADDNAPALLEIPNIRGRYYTAQVLDEWGEVIVNINDRTFPTKPSGRFALMRPGSNPQVPDDAARVILHSSKAKLLARVELKGAPAEAVALQKQFKLSSLGSPVVAPPPTVMDFDNQSLMGVEIFDDVDATLSSALDVSPIAATLQQKVRAVAAQVLESPVTRALADDQLREDIVPAFHDYALTKSAVYRNNWLGGPAPGGGVPGEFGKDFRLRTMVNLMGIWANTPDEVQYFSTGVDRSGAPLDGDRNYVIHFPADDLPDTVVNGYWSVILVSIPDYRVTPNPLNRFNLNTYSPLVKEADGSLNIAIGPRPVSGVAESNWLPSPDGKAFSLTFRAYVPVDKVKRGEWSPPPVVRTR